MGEGAGREGVSEHGLKANAIGLVVVAVGVQAPAVLLASFVPMFFIAARSST